MELDQVIHGRWEDITGGISDSSVQLIHTDPPYQCTPKKWDKRPDWKVFIPELTRIASEDGQLWIYVRMPWAIDVYNEAIANGWKYRQEVIWEKQNAGGCTVDTFRKVHENIWHFVRPGAKTFNIDAVKTAKTTSGDKSVKARGNSDTQFLGKKNSGYIDDGTRLPRTVQHIRNVHRTKEATGHPTQKPVQLTNLFVLYSSNPGDIVFDPYCGSGTTLVSAASNGRHYLGIDGDEWSVQVARDRLSSLEESFLDIG